MVERTLNRRSFAIVALVVAGCKPPEPDATTPPLAPVTPIALEAGASSPDPAHNARNSLDWQGTYRGVLPCADCEGIETVVSLGGDSAYRIQSRYLGRSDGVFSEEGRFSWNEAGNTVTLGGAEPGQYFVAENRLIRLALDGSRITGALADNYVLDKIAGR